MKTPRTDDLSPRSEIARGKVDGTINRLLDGLVNDCTVARIGKPSVAEYVRPYV